MKLTILVVLLASVSSILALPDGAPAASCINLTPTHGAAPQPPPSPYTIDLSAFVVPNMTGLYFTPGVTYTITLQAVNNSDATFRGFLIQGRPANGVAVPAGAFMDPTDNPNARLSSCQPNTWGVTHVNTGPRANRLDFIEMMFNWTAPEAGTGPVQFQFTTVQTFSVYWVAQRSETIQELGGPATNAPPPTTPPPVTTPPPGTTTPPDTTAPPGTTGTPFNGATSLSGVGFWAILATAIFTAAKMVV